MKNYEINITPMMGFERDVSRKVAAVFVDGYEKDLAFLERSSNVN